MNLQVDFDEQAAGHLAEYFQTTGMPRVAEKIWLSLSFLNPYRLEPRERVGNLFFEQRQAEHPLGTLDRSLFILRIITESFPTRTLTEAYFENLELLLRQRTRLAAPGTIALGIGTGRCGSTTLAEAVAGAGDVCATHENPPAIFWEPAAAQVDFQMRRFRMLADYFPLVFDAAHWWLNVLDRFYAEFPQGRVVGLVRDAARCAQSFVNVKGSGIATLNHWAPPGNRIWATSWGDPCYPSYRLPADAIVNPDGVKAGFIARYVDEYNRALQGMAQRYAARLLLVRTESLSEPATEQELSEFLGLAVRMPSSKLNCGTTADSNKHEHMF